MGSTGLLGGGPRGSLGRAWHSSVQSFLGQQSCCALVADHENERRTSPWGCAESSEPLACSFSGRQSPAASAVGGARCGLQNDSACHGGGTARYSGVQTSALFSTSGPWRATSNGMAVGQSCSRVSRPSAGILPSAPPMLCRVLESTADRALGLPNFIARGLGPSLKVRRSLGSVPRKGSKENNLSSLSGQQRRSVRAMAVSPDDGKKILSTPEFREAAEVQMKEWGSKPFFRNPASESDASWEQLNMVVRVVYAIAMYGGLVVAGNAICSFTGVDSWGGFKPSIQTFVQAVGWAIPPMMALLLTLEDEVVKVCPPARAIRDAEDEELMDFFVGMNPWQFIFVVAAGSISEELFFRVAIQGGLAHALQYTAKGADETIIGVSALTTVIPFFAPFAQAFAAVLTASLTGSMYYVISCPKDPTYVIAPVPVNKYGWNDRRDIKKRIEAWNERRQLKKIYSPLMEALLALYLGFEWVQTGNIFGPMTTHALYSLVVAGNGLRRIYDNRFKLRQRVSMVTQQKDDSSSDVV